MVSEVSFRVTGCAMGNDATVLPLKNDTAYRLLVGVNEEPTFIRKSMKSLHSLGWYSLPICTTRPGTS